MDIKILDLLKWYLEILEEQERSMVTNLERSKKWNLNWINFFQSQTTEEGIFNKVNINDAFLVGVFIQAANRFNMITQEFLKPYRDDDEFNNIPDNLLILSLPDQEANKYLTKLKSLISEINIALESGQK